MNAWHLRWFTFSCNQVTPIQVRSCDEDEKYVYPQFDTSQVDKAHLLLNFNSKREYIFLAPSEFFFPQW